MIIHIYVTGDEWCRLVLANRPGRRAPAPCPPPPPPPPVAPTTSAPPPPHAPTSTLTPLSPSAIEGGEAGGESFLLVEIGRAHV